MATAHSTPLVSARRQWLPHSQDDIQLFEARFGLSKEEATSAHFIERSIYEWSDSTELTTEEIARAIGWHPALVRECGDFQGGWLFTVRENGTAYAGDVAAHLARAAHDDRYAEMFEQLREWAVARCLDRLEGLAPQKGHAQ